MAAPSAATLWRVHEKLPERSAELGAYALARLQAMRSSVVKAVRGKGLWIGIELNVASRPYCEKLKGLGVLCKETHATVIRLAPPLVISREDLDWGLAQMEQVLGD
jgi:ornithine--oxo-acid transaminase